MQEDIQTPKNNELDILGFLKDLWSLRKKIIKWAIIGGAIGIVIAYSIPKEYTAQVKLLAESSSQHNNSGAGAIASMMGLTMSDQQTEIPANFYPEIFSSSPFLMEFASIKVPYAADSIKFSEYILKHQNKPWWSYIISSPSMLLGWVSSWGTNDDVKPTMENSQAVRNGFCYLFSRNISVVYDKQKRTILIKAKMQSADVSRIIVDSLYSKLQNYVLMYNTQKSRQTLNMSQTMKNEAYSKYIEADSIYSHTADRNQNITSIVAKAKIDKVQDERNIAFNVYQQMASQVKMAEIKLLEATPIATVIEPSQTPLNPSKPNKLIIIVGLAFCFGFIYIGVRFAKALIES